MEEPRISSSSWQGSFALPKEIRSRKVEEIWKEIAAGGKGDGGDGSGLEMTLEDFLARNGAAREEDVRVPLGSAQGGFGLDSGVGGEFRPAPAVAAAGDGLRKGERRNGEIVKEYISEWTTRNLWWTQASGPRMDS